MIDYYQAKPYGAILISPPVVSYSEVIRWQLYERYIKWLEQIPHKDNIITFDDIKNGYGRSPQAFIDNISKIIPYKGYRDNSDLQNMRRDGRRNYENLQTAALAHADDEPRPAAAPLPKPPTPGGSRHL